ncbi:uncharacterized protein LOC108091981 [Drosophila ficusphila]|uniref:uncharacterized protein LOC108091981 n=1 Tax=Drosophila ficusphila TaxID=30025 RepID=UPI0007E7D538|nr:uncharacterized protein LOC108091981 [Drosophila ficusphila]
MLTRKGVITLLVLCCIGLLRTFELNESDPKCSNCKQLQARCLISKSGIFCTNKTDRQKIKFTTEAQSDYSTLGDCVPEKYAVIGPIMDWCCLWSPQMGCQQLAGYYYQNQSDWEQTCGLCEHSCPCNEDRNRMARTSPRRWCDVLGILAVLSRTYLLS